MKKILSVLLTLALCLSLLPAALASEEPERIPEEVIADAVEESAEEASEEPAAETPEQPATASEEESGSDDPEEADNAGEPEAAAEEPPALDGAYSLVLNAAKWSYNKNNDVYYQTGVVYCAKPASTALETLNIYVPAAYMTAKSNGDGTYTCTVKESGKVGNYTAKTAPFVMPVDTPGYSYQTAKTSYSSYTKAGMIYVGAGCRGKDDRNNYPSVYGGAPWGVTDLKAAIRYIRYNSGSLPGNADYFFAFGHSGGGAQTSVLGASGNSALYTPYLESIGACMTYDDGTAISDAIYGAMAWCPITSLDMADAAYEWNMGQYARTGNARYLSYDLADAYAGYVNALGLSDGYGNKLTLETSDTYEYAAGSYYEFMLSEIERSRRNYISDGGSTPAAVTSLYGLVANGVKKAEKSVPAFDGLTGTVTENLVFGNGHTGSGRHFDAALGGILADSGSRSYSAYGSYASAFASDLAAVDDWGMTTQTRADMYNPMYYLCDYYAGAKTADVAPHWRIHSGLTQNDTALCVEMNLALALRDYGVKSLELEMVWGKGHTEAERTGSSSTNFIAWVYECVSGTASGCGDLGSCYTPSAPAAAENEYYAAAVLRYLVGRTEEADERWDADDSDTVTIRDAVLLLGAGS